MAQSSRPQAGNKNPVFGNPAFVDAGPWSRDQWAEKVKAENTGDANTVGQRTRLRGVMPTNDNLLVVTNPTGVSIVVGTGVGIATGTLLFNTAAVTFTPNTPGIASRTDKVVMVENNTNVAYDGTASGVILDFPTDLTDYSGAASVPPYACRLAILRGDAATGAATALVQSADYWMIELARFNITNVPAVNTLTDYREFANIESVVGVVAANNTTVKDAAVFGVEVNDGAGAAGLGVGLKFRLENSAGTAEDAGQIAVRYTDAAAADETRLELRLKAGGSDNLSAVINAPTTASADGNARGAGAVDLQQERNAVTQVASGASSAVGGGRHNTASAQAATAAGGASNIASGAASTVSGGASSTASGSWATVAGGFTNIASGTSSFAVGDVNTASGSYSSTPGGKDNTADGVCSLAAGRQADTNGFDGVFIWADNEIADFAASAANTFNIRSSGGFFHRLNTALTNAIQIAKTIIHATSGAAAALFGVSEIHQLEDAAGNVQTASENVTLWAASTSGLESPLLRRSTYPKGTVGPGYEAIWGWHDLDTTARTVIPNGAGDVTNILYFHWVIVLNSGATNSGTATATPGGGAVDLFNFGGEQYTLTVNADGSVQVVLAVTAGLGSADVELSLLWI